MHILIGNDNTINNRLSEELLALFPISCLSFEVIESLKEDYQEGYIFFNLLDINVTVEQAFLLVKSKYPRKKIIGIHCFQVEQMINSILVLGFDAYISLFNFSEDVEKTLQRITQKER
ncbi:hypothetical protein [Flammeovirga sp. SubArs3]|uniref:hypothetical protein n=1 Tax=Flammeovirga sp. SubArs3 TaxID=2995316 RepID=UPI00248C3483|nr:hypothetical protein [Flammeovirga sp. SubArs3]